MEERKKERTEFIKVERRTRTKRKKKCKKWIILRKKEWKKEIRCKYRNMGLWETEHNGNRIRNK